MVAYHDALPTGWISSGETTAVDVDGRVVAIADVKGEYFAFENACPHQGTELGGLSLHRDCRLRCPLHGSKYDVRSGQCVLRPTMASAGTWQPWRLVLSRTRSKSFCNAGPDSWGEKQMAGIAPGDMGRLGQMSTFSGLTKHRVVHDFAYVLVAHRLFERFPKLKVAFIENGCAWVPSLLQALEYLGHGQSYKTNPKDQFIEHCWVAPFVEEDVTELARHIPVDRVLFGSDWPHGEGFPTPKEFLNNVAGFTAGEQRRIMYDNAKELTLNR